MNLLRALDPKLYDLLQPYRATEEQMPWAYRHANPKGRPYHDDWAFGKNIRRIDCAYRVPLPFKVTGGSFRKEWLLWNDNYPLSPDTPKEYRTIIRPHGTFTLPFVLTDRGNYGLVTYSAFIAGEWRVVFKKYTGKWFGKRLSWYVGLHQDNHVSEPDANGITRSDLMTWFPEVACSYVTEI